MTAQLPDGVSIAADKRLERAIIPLRTPIKHGAEIISTLELQELTGAHVRQAPEDWRNVGAVLEFAGILSGLPPSTMDQLVGPDVGDVVRAAYLVSWPVLDLPIQWEVVWEHQRAEFAGTAKALEIPAALPYFPGGFELTLERQVTLERETFSRLAFSEMTGRVARRCPTEGVSVNRLPWLVCELTGAPRGVVDKLAGRDLNRALALAQVFFFAIRGTSGTSG